MSGDSKHDPPESLAASHATLEFVPPALTLPADVVSIIFVLCLPTHGRVAPSPTAAPLLLAQICRSWREVAIDTCQLWSSIYLDFPDPFLKANRAQEESFKKVFHLLETWVSRAKGHPLSFGVDKGSGRQASELLSMLSGIVGDREVQKAISPALLHFMAMHSGQIQRLEVAHVSATQFRQIIPINTPLPLLESLAAPYVDHLRDIIEGAPSLRELSLFGGKPVTDAVDFSSRILTSLELGKHIGTATLFRLLPEFPALERLKCGVSHWHPGLMPATPTTHARLRSFILGGYESTFVLNMLVLPNLRSLVITDYPFLDVILSFVTRSSCVLRTLGIGVEEFKKVELASFLAAFPFVETLEIDVCPSVDRVISCIRAPSMLPRLTSLTISATRAGGMDYSRLVALLRQRKKTADTATFRHLRIDLCKPSKRNDEFSGSDDGDGGKAETKEKFLWIPKGSAASALRKLVAEGLDLVLSLKSDEGTPRYWPDRYFVVDPMEDTS
ncbi:hypothetical protein DFH06DRAFT_1476049 [Mycena polygramma]|nr:hypothetical protein DFH06DRAFT_1227344 [Mycena polygramma]KAJ7649093.1 hypothetical protein DFH06DRAFT_1476049 [Mycena polygramma]